MRALSLVMVTARAASTLLAVGKIENFLSRVFVACCLVDMNFKVRACISKAILQL